MLTWLVLLGVLTTRSSWEHVKRSEVLSGATSIYSTGVRCSRLFLQHLACHHHGRRFQGVAVRLGVYGDPGAAGTASVTRESLWACSWVRQLFAL